MYSGGGLGLSGADSLTLTGTFGGGTATLSQYFPPSLGLSYSEAIDAAGFGNDRATGRPVRLTFTVPMSSVAVQFLYQDPAEDGRGNEYGVRLSAGQVTATFYGVNGAVVATTSGLTYGAQGGMLGAAFDGNLPQGEVRASAPIAAMEIAMPAGFGSESWLAGAVPYGRVDYTALAQDAAARNAATTFADQVLRIATPAWRQVLANEQGIAAAQAALDKSPNDSQWIAYVAGAHSVYDDDLISLSLSVADLQTIVSTNLASPNQIQQAKDLLTAILQHFPDLTATVAAARARGGRTTVGPTPPVAPAPIDTTYAPPTPSYQPPVTVTPSPEAKVQAAPQLDQVSVSPTYDQPIVTAAPGGSYQSPTGPSAAPAVTTDQPAAAPPIATSISGGVLLAIAAVGLYLGSRKNRRREL